MKTMSVKVFTRIACLIMAVAMAVSLVGCGVDITSVGLPTDIVLEKGETQQLNIEYGTDDKAEQEKIAEAASKLNLTWTSSDETVATVDETGQGRDSPHRGRSPRNSESGTQRREQQGPWSQNDARGCNRSQAGIRVQR